MKRAGLPSPNQDSRHGAAISMLVLHYTGMASAEAALARLCDPAAKVSAHYTIDEDGPVKRFGFAYGTLEDHAESGEVRFLVEWHRESDEVWYDLLAFSRPNQFLARVGYPFSRRLQKKFASESKAAMVKAVGE